MKTLVTLLTIAVAVWWVFLWGIFAAFVVIGMLVPDPGTIIRFRTSWWFVAVVLALGPMGLLLLRSALRSRKGTVALTGVVALVLLNCLRDGPFAGLMRYLSPALLLLPVLWLYHFPKAKKTGT